MSFNAKHKGDRGSAYLIYLGMEADDDFNPNQLSKEHFNEYNFTEEELISIARKATDFRGATLVARHPNASPVISAIVGVLLLEGESEVASVEL